MAETPREIILKVLTEISENGIYSHKAIRGALDKYQYLSRRDRAFINRVCEGTIERMIEQAEADAGCDQALLAGGVASSLLFREMLRRRAARRRLRCKLFFARPELSGDNAVGVALLGADRLKGEKRHGGDSD